MRAQCEVSALRKIETSPRLRGGCARRRSPRSRDCLGPDLVFAPGPGGAFVSAPAELHSFSQAMPSLSRSSPRLYRIAVL